MHNEKNKRGSGSQKVVKRSGGVVHGAEASKSAPVRRFKKGAVPSSSAPFRKPKK